MSNTKENNIEIEVKFLINDPKEIRSKLKHMGIDSIGNIFERNHRYDDLHSSLLKNKRLLRLRSDQKNILTFKKPVSVKNMDFKINEEIEVEVSDFDQMEKILNEIGFSRVQSYEKFRETFAFEDAKILIDNMPYGTFIEIEGTEESIRHYAHVFCLDWDKKITINYLEIFENISKRLKLSFRDVTFENFKQLKASFCIDPSDLGLQAIQ